MTTGRSYAGLVTLITGGGSGIGAATARLLASRGGKVAVMGRTAATVERSAADASAAGGEALPLVGDVASRDDVERAVCETVTTFGRTDALVANAGVQQHAEERAIHESEDDVWDRTLDVNACDVFLTCRAGILQMVEQGEGGAVVITSSITALVGTNGHNPAYTASKGALLSLGRAPSTAARSASGSTSSAPACSPSRPTSRTSPTRRARGARRPEHPAGPPGPVRRDRADGRLPLRPRVHLRHGDRRLVGRADPAGDPTVDQRHRPGHAAHGATTNRDAAVKEAQAAYANFSASCAESRRSTRSDRKGRSSKRRRLGRADAPRARPGSAGRVPVPACLGTRGPGPRARQQPGDGGHARGGPHCRDAAQKLSSKLLTRIRKSPPWTATATGFGCIRAAMTLPCPAREASRYHVDECCEAPHLSRWRWTCRVDMS